METTQAITRALTLLSAAGAAGVLVAILISYRAGCLLSWLALAVMITRYLRAIGALS